MSGAAQDKRAEKRLQTDNMKKILNLGMAVATAARLTGALKRIDSATLARALFICLFAAVNASAAVHYVDVSGTNPTPPYTNWTKAAKHIQDAVNVSAAADKIMVTNGVYAGAVNVTNPLALVSVNGPQFTVINGDEEGGIYLNDGASLSGFTLTNGGWVACTSTNVFVTNCVIVGNSGRGATGGTLYNCTLAGNSGGGAAGSTLFNCVLISNQVVGYWVYDLPTRWHPGVWVYEPAPGGGASVSTLYNCLLIGNIADYGGGAANCTLYNCALTGNVCRDSSMYTNHYAGFGGGAADSTLYYCTLATNSAGVGGGTYGGTLYNCTLTANSSTASGGGVFRGTLYNCTLTGNSALGSGGGACGGTLYNCIVYFNSATNGANYYYYTNSILNYCCSTLLPTNGVGNITNAPLFVNTNGWSNLHLRTNSPGINAGTNAYVTTTTDLDGNPRIAGGTVDMGAYEFQPCIIGGQFCDAVCSRLTGFSFTFSGAIVGQPYRIQISTTLAAGSWTDVTNFTYTRANCHY